MKRRRLSAALLLAGMASSTCPALAQTQAAPEPEPPSAWAASPRGAALQLSTDRFSDPLPLSDLLASRLAGVGPRHTHSLIYLRDEARLSASWTAPAHTTATLSVLARQSATLVASRGAVVLTQDIAQSGPPPGDYDASVGLRLRAFAGWGAELGWQGMLADAGVHWQAALQGLQLQRVMTRDIAGWVHFDAASASYATQLSSDEFNDHHHYPFQGPANDRGWAWLGRVHLRWQASPQWAWSAGAEDLGRLRWSRLAHETSVLNSQVTSTDSQGNVVYASLVNGHNGQDTLDMRAPATWRVGAEWTWQPGTTVEADARKITGVQPWLPYSGVRLQWGEGQGGWVGSAGWRWYERALQLGLSHGPWQVQLAGDALNASARSRMASLRWQGQW